MTRVWVMFVGDIDTGAATRPVGVVGVDETGCWWVSWLDPYTDWGPLIGGLDDDRDPAATIAGWVELVNGLTLDLVGVGHGPQVEQPATDPGSLVGVVDVVEGVIDRVLAGRW